MLFILNPQIAVRTVWHNIAKSKLDSLCLLNDSSPLPPYHPHPPSPSRLAVCCFRPLLFNMREKGVLVHQASC